MNRVQNPAAAERASARESRPIRAFRLGNEPGEDLSSGTTAAERLEMIWPLTLDAWALAGRAIPDYPRQEAPIRVIHGYIRGERQAQGSADLEMLEQREPSSE